MQLVDELIERVAEQFASVTIAGTTYAIMVEWPHTPKEDLKAEDLRTPRLWVIDASDVSESLPGGIAADDFGVLFVLQMAIPRAGLEAVTHRALSAVMAELKAYLRPADPDTPFIVELDDDDGDSVFCLKAERRAGKNLGDWIDKRIYYSELLTTWRMY